MTSPSSTAGKPCVECGIPDPCIFDVISDFPEAGEKHFWSKEGMARFKLLDDGFGCDGIITITYQCEDVYKRQAISSASIRHSQNHR